MNKSLLTLALVAIVLTGAGTQASAQTAPANVQAVDLGLPSGLKWASCNVGATAPEDYGNYYAWGETETKADYSWATYMYANGAYNKLTKYCTNASYGDNGFTDNKTTLDPEDDAAHVNWGGDWRMPTDAEWTELREQCTWTWTMQNGVYGYQVTSKINSNSIFLPAAGYRYDTRLYYAGNDGRYWSSSLFAGYQNNAWSISFNPKTGRDYYGRNFGFPVRPVQDKQEEEVESAYVPKPFTVAEGKQITFSGGNLQYTQSTQTWAFAEHQYDMLGDANVNGSTLADKIDLFGWSGSTATAKWGIGTSQSHSDYSGDFADWGTNTIGTDAPDTWRTLTKDEWYYLRYSRANADDLVGVARIDLNADGSKYVNGLVLLPDDWTCPAGVTFKSGFFDTNSVQAYADYQTFTLADWQKLEAAGAVFLPASGLRLGSNVRYMQYYGDYWSATPDDSGYALEFNFNSDGAYASNYDRNYGLAVRLVKDKQEEVVEPAYVAKPFTVAEGKQITFSGGNLQYTPSTQTWAFAEHQYDMLGEANITTGADGNKVLADKIDLFGWSGSTATAKWGIGTSQSHSDYSGDFADWGTNTIGTDAPDTWRTLTKDEWYYLRYSRANADDLVGVARIDLNADGSKYVNGLVLLPDDWTCPAGVTFKSGFFDTNSVQAYADYQTFTLADWQKLEAAGAVFLPASGLRLGSNVRYMQYYGDYWSATPDDSGYALEFNFNSDGAYASNYDRNYGLAVRLVKDKQEEVVEPAYVAKPFTVAEGKRITFSGGNLQYTQSTQAWAFAEHQYDMLGTDNVDGSTLADKIDLFGWSGSTGRAKWGISTSTDYNDYSGDFVDWGTNTIGTDAPDTWRTLTIDEWQYLFMHTRWTMAKVNGTLGFMLLPADFVVPAGLTISILGDGNMSDNYKNFSESDYSANVYTVSQFSQLESAGVVFLPCAGFHRGSSVGNVGSVGYYWSATPCDTDRAGYVYFGSWNAFANGWYDCSLGQSVRLVKNYSNVSTDIARPSAADTGEVRKVLRNGQVLIERNGKMYTLTGVEVK